jgi:UDP-N-acetylmuramate dehydrogenase
MTLCLRKASDLLVGEMLPNVLGEMTKNKSLASLTWFRVGGSADWFFEPATLQDLCFFLQKKSPHLPCTFLGAGSNMLIRDGGVPGVVIRLGKAFQTFSIVGDGVVNVGGAVLDKRLAMFAYEAGISGFEFLYTIPGTLGGALRMNAGAYGSEIAERLVYAVALSPTGKIHYFKPEELDFSYRSCGLPDGWVFISARLCGIEGPQDKIYQTMLEFQERRQLTQPAGKTGGSTFKNPPGYKAWELIQAAGCARASLGDARISEKHCNFIVNKGEATARQIEGLGERVKRRVLEKTGIDLEWEIVRVGRR